MGESIKLYELVPRIQDAAITPNFSSHVWKAKLIFKYFDIPYTRVPLTFVQIRNDLAQEYGDPKITVPTIQFTPNPGSSSAHGETSKEGSRHITDSWNIALWAEEHYSEVRGKSLFGSGDTATADGKALGIWANEWVRTVLYDVLGDMIYPRVYAMLDPPSAHYFLYTKKKVTETWVTESNAKLSNPQWVQAQSTKARTALSALERLLTLNGGESTWLNGVSPTYADFVIFGFYAFSRINPDCLEHVWLHSDFPGIRKWLEGSEREGLVDPRDLWIPEYCSVQK